MHIDIFIMLWLLFVISLCKEVALTETESEDTSGNSNESDEVSADEINILENQCCSEITPDCCVSLTYIDSISAEKDVPQEFGGVYYCENMSVKKTGDCGNLDYILLPVSSSCDFTRVLWDLRWISSNKNAKGFIKAQVLADNEIVLNNADEFLLSPNDEDNPTGYHALKFPIESDPWNVETQTIAICTQLEWGNITSSIDENDIDIGFSIGGNDRFKCSNASIRDICSIDSSLASYNAVSKAINVVNLYGLKGENNMDDPRFDRLYNTFEYYWNQYVGFGIAVFAASMFFNIVMCIYWSGYRTSYYYAIVNTQRKISTLVNDIDSDDQTEEESDYFNDDL